MAVVVLLPCVPETAMTSRPARRGRRKDSRLTTGIPSECAVRRSRLVSSIALLMRTTSGRSWSGSSVSSAAAPWRPKICAPGGSQAARSLALLAIAAADVYALLEENVGDGGEAGAAYPDQMDARRVVPIFFG